MLRLVLDTSVIVAALRSQAGASNALLRKVANGQITPLLTTALFFEYESVLKRPTQMSAIDMNEKEIDQFLAALASASQGVDVNFRYRPQLRDPADEMVLEAALNGGANALVTHNLRDFQLAAQNFGLRVLLPRDALQELAT